MKLAETAGSRCALVLVSLAFGATAIVAASHRCTKRAPVTKSMNVTTVKPWSGCKQRVVRQTPQVREQREFSGDDYRDILMSAKFAFERCMWDQPEGVKYTLRASIGGDGRVESVDVRGEHPDLTKVDMHVVKCMEEKMSDLAFPANHTFTQVSTTFITPPAPIKIANEPGIE
jgi:hypothetical protein